MDTVTFITVISLIISVIAFLYMFISEDRKRTESVNKMATHIEKMNDSTTSTLAKVEQQIAKTQQSNEILLDDARQLVKDITEFRKASEQIRPDFTTFVSNQWRFFDRMSHYRYEKLGICHRIVEKWISPGDVILLDSGSTTDQITSELIVKKIPNVTIHSNNVLAAMHLSGTNAVRFHLLPGEYFQRSWAVYSDEALNRLDQLGITLFIFGVAVVRFSGGIMFRTGENGNAKFKKRALEIFQAHSDTKAIIAIDSSKFGLPTKGHEPVLSQQEWQKLLRTAGDRMIIVTSQVPESTFGAEQRSTILTQVEQFTSYGIKVDMTDTV